MSQSKWQPLYCCQKLEMTLIQFSCNQPSIPKDHDVVTLHKVIEQIERNFSSDKEKVKVDEGDILKYYKDSKIDARMKLRVLYF